MWTKIFRYFLPVLITAIYVLSYSGAVRAAIEGCAVSLSPASIHRDLFHPESLSPPGEDLFFRQFSCPAEKIGRILPGKNYAWGENIGWVDFSPGRAPLEIGKNILAGWIRVDNLGWVRLGSGRPRDGHRYSNLDPGDYGVNNDGSGNLSGWAWGETFGWISFEGVRIDSNGSFSGYARADNVGYILLESSGRFGFAVRTDPYPWASIGVGEEIKAATACGGSPSVGDPAVSAGYSVIASPGGELLFTGLVPSVCRLELVSGRREFKTDLIFLSRYYENNNSERGPPGSNTLRCTGLPEDAYSTRLSPFVGLFCV